jgi:hypothetical protein
MPSAGFTPEWQPLAAHVALKIVWTCANVAVPVPHAQTPPEQL